MIVYPGGCDRCRGATAPDISGIHCLNCGYCGPTRDGAFIPAKWDAPTVSYEASVRAFETMAIHDRIRGRKNRRQVDQLDPAEVEAIRRRARLDAEGYLTRKPRCKQAM